MNSTDTTTVEQTRRSRLEGVIDAFEKPLLRYAAGIVGDHSLAQDAVQEAFVALSSQWHRNMAPVSEDHLRNWLFKVTHDRAVSMLRAEKTRMRVHDDFAKESGDGTDCPGFEGEAGISRETQMRVLMESLEVLIPSRKQVLLLRLQQGLSHESIAAITGHSVIHCRKLLHEAVKLLNAEVARRLNSEEGHAQ